MKATRLVQMETYIEKHEFATMDELCAEFGISMNTVRRDVVELVKRGGVEKVYGGVSIRKSTEPSLTPFEQRYVNNLQEKEAIGRRAAQLVQDGDIIFVDSGTTTLQVIDFLADKKDLTVVTNNLEAIVRLVPYSDISVISLPGQLRRKTNSFTGLEAVRMLSAFNIHLALMAATGVTQAGVTNSSSLEFEIKKCAIQSSQKSVLMLTSSKFGYAGLMTYAGFDAFSAVITDKKPAPTYAQILQKNGVELIVAE